MTEFITRRYGNDGYEVIIKTDSEEHYKAAQDFARQLIDHAKPKNNADRIRAMADEELAALLGNDDRACPPKHPNCPKYVNDCTGCFLEWLQRPAEGME